MSQPSASPDKPARPADDKAGPNYRKTLNLPSTAFPMKANLVQNEPASLARWQAQGLYERLRDLRKGRDPFVFHDGPPYANGDIHLGHLLNKCLKDFVVRTRTMAGNDCPYIPGWDCHGLPIEHKVMAELVASGKIEKLAGLDEDARRMAIRKACRAYAEKYVKLQAGQMTRLLTLADYANPYLTMSPEFEGATTELFASMVEQGVVFRQLKPVHWSIANQTALAEAELEYQDRRDPSIYVDFEADDADAVYDAFALPPHNDDDDEEDAGDRVEGVRPSARPSFMIWTTTPWTLPANLAIAVHPKFEYALVRMDGNFTIVARDLLETVKKAGEAEDAQIVATTLGENLVGLRYRHPLINTRELAAALAGADSGADHPSRSREEQGEGAPLHSVVAADYVTLDDGTGLVHTAPGHGVEDYQTGLRVGLPIYCPVQGDGTYDNTAPDFLRGVSIWDANKAITDRLRDSGHLFHFNMFSHSYPHDWRSKTPVIFRATEQWFVGVDRETKHEGKTLRELGLASTASDTKFVPEWGRNRLRGMLESRPDWCISRQRAWGLPIPAFYEQREDGEQRVLLTPASVRAVAKVFREKGSDAWFTMSPSDLLAHYDAKSDLDAPRDLDLSRLVKGSDILDVWFESGSSWHAVMRERLSDAGFPVDLYLEGSDQHRGWFQSSLLNGLAATGRPPFNTVLTHGFMVDKDGKKMSKSLGNALNVEDLLKNFGADVCRWWVASLAFENDIKVDLSFFETAGESYRKVRNTLRFLLSNLADFQQTDNPSFDPSSIDAWALSEYDALQREVIAAYERYDFRAAHSRLYNFCNDTLSSVYLAAVKDRLYCDKPDSPRRRRTQAAIWSITDGLCRLLAPLIPHTADEAFRALHGLSPQDKQPEPSVHLQTFRKPLGVRAAPQWSALLKTRDTALLALENEKKREGGVENPLDAGLTLPDSNGALAEFDAVDLADLMGVSRVMLDAGATSVIVHDLRGEPRCDRSWKRDGTVKQRSDGGMLTDRDAEAVDVA